MENYPAVVGPDLFLLLQGRLFDDDANDGGKNISLILCGESHNDAIDVTRRSPPGKFEPNEGWIKVFDSLQSDGENDIYRALPRALFIASRHANGQSRSQTSAQLATLPTIENLAIRFLHPVNGRKNKAVTLDRARKLALAFVEKYDVEDDMFGHNLLLLWVATSSGRAEKGEAFLLEIETEAEIDELEHDDDNDDDNNSDSDEEEYDDWVFFSSDTATYNNPLQQRNRMELPELVAEWMDDVMMVVHDDDSTFATIDDTVDDLSEEIDGSNNDENGNVVDNTDVPSRQTRLMNRRLGRYVLFEYGDLDLEAYNITKRRLGMTDTKMTSSEYDNVIESRKRVLKDKDNVLTFDDWFDIVKFRSTKLEDTKTNIDGHQRKAIESQELHNVDPAVHLILEASVPPWEVELHRPQLKGESNETKSEAENFRLHPASRSVRCLPEDSEASWEDECDPSNDGIGSYVDFVYRKMMASTMKGNTKYDNEGTTGVIEEIKINDGKDNNGNQTDTNTIRNRTTHCSKDENSGDSWLHCIDARDLGCEAACHAESVKQQWYELLSEDEKVILTNLKDVPKDACPINERGDALRFLPHQSTNPEQIELERLRTEGLLIPKEDADATTDQDEGDRDNDNLEFTFPSFELFFGANTDILYYSPHVKMAYFPFLMYCVESLDNWKAFFNALFFGGTIPEALETLNLRSVDNRQSLHVRSPILQQWDPQTNSYVWKERNDDEYYATCPYFPFAVHLKAKGSSPPRTWSSQLFADLYEMDGGRRKLALLMKSWILDSIHRNMDDPKDSDDKECGGEWFDFYLREVHRDIYDDIDTSDSTVLLQKNYMKSLSGRMLKKHNIGKIKIPSAEDAFQEMRSHYNQWCTSPSRDTINLVTPQVEVLAKILIDIWVSNLFDFSLLLKIANICAKETKDNIVVVCYVGSGHARATSSFFCEKLGFQRKELIGKFTWEDDEIQTLNLPSKLWNFSELFR